jgi:glutamine phosphoribosylpyrophosphate amidotransferase
VSDLPASQVPDTSRVAALQASVVLQKTYREGFIKNRYVGRTFIMPGQAERYVHFAPSRALRVHYSNNMY